MPWRGRDETVYNTGIVSETAAIGELNWRGGQLLLKPIRGLDPFSVIFLDYQYSL